MNKPKEVEESIKFGPIGENGKECAERLKRETEPPEKEANDCPECHFADGHENSCSQFKPPEKEGTSGGEGGGGGSGRYNQGIIDKRKHKKNCAHVEYFKAHPEGGYLSEIPECSCEEPPEKEGWAERFDELWSWFLEEYQPIKSKVKSFIEKELRDTESKAYEMGKLFEKAFIKKEIQKAREEGYKDGDAHAHLKSYEQGVAYGYQRGKQEAIEEMRRKLVDFRINETEPWATLKRLREFLDKIK